MAWGVRKVWATLRRERFVVSRISDPLMIPKLVQALLRAGFPDATVEQLVWKNPVAFFAQSGRLDVAALDRPPTASRRETHDGNTILRGQDPDRS